MRKLKVAGLLLFFGLIVTDSALSQATGKSESRAFVKKISKTHTNIDWKSFDTTSSVTVDSLSYAVMQGNWKAYYGIFIFDGAMNSMELTTPMELEFKEDTYRFGQKSEAQKFTITKNYVRATTGDAHFYINKLTDHLLVMTLDNGENYTRYYYEK